MFNIKWISVRHLAPPICLSLVASVSGGSAFGQHYHTHPHPATYSHVRPTVAPTHVRGNQHMTPPYRPSPHPTTYFQVQPTVYHTQMQGSLLIPPAQQTGTIRQVFSEATAPTSTSVHAVPAPTPPNFLPPAPPPGAIPPVPLPGPTGVHSAPPPTMQGHVCTECSESHSGPCNLLCRVHKKFVGLFRASQRRSECHFQYPVAPPTGAPYGYVQPTWSDFCAEPTLGSPGPEFYGAPKDVVPEGNYR